MLIHHFLKMSAKPLLVQFTLTLLFALQCLRSAGSTSKQKKVQYLPVYIYLKIQQWNEKDFFKKILPSFPCLNLLNFFVSMTLSQQKLLTLLFLNSRKYYILAAFLQLHVLLFTRAISKEHFLQVFCRCVYTPKNSNHRSICIQQ